MTIEKAGIIVNSEIERLEKLLSQKKLEQSALQRTCNHKWLDAIYDPEEVSEFVFTHYEPHGSDPIPRGFYKSKQKPRWSRVCECCGKKEYTYEKKPVIKCYEPSF